MARKILLADDSVTAQNMGRKILADAGYDVITVNNGSAALKRITELKPDLIVLDVYMPGYSGLEVCQRLKESAETSHIPVLLTVGKLEPFKPEEARRAKADAHIVKPFEASELLTAITRLEDRVVPQQAESNTDLDTGWKSRLRFPSKKKKEEPEPEPERDDFAPAPVFRDFRKGKGQKETREAFAVKAAAPPPEPEPALVPDIPRDITPEELDALSALAAKLDGPAADENTAALAEKTDLAEVPAAEFAAATAEVETPAVVAEAKKEEEQKEEVETPAPPAVETVEMAAAVEAPALAVEAKAEVESPVEQVEPASEVTAAVADPVPVAAEEVSTALLAQEPAPVDRDDEPGFASAATEAEPAAEDRTEKKVEEKPAEQLQAETPAPPLPVVETAQESAAEELAPSDAELAEALRLLTPATGHADVATVPSPETLLAAGQVSPEEAAGGPRWVAEPVALSSEEAAISLEAEMFRTFAAKPAATPVEEIEPARISGVQAIAAAVENRLAEAGITAATESPEPEAEPGSSERGSAEHGSETRAAETSVAEAPAEGMAAVPNAEIPSKAGIEPEIEEASKAEKSEAERRNPPENFAEEEPAGATFANAVDWEKVETAAEQKGEPAAEAMAAVAEENQDSSSEDGGQESMSTDGKAKGKSNWRQIHTAPASAAAKTDVVEAAKQAQAEEAPKVMAAAAAEGSATDAGAIASIVDSVLADLRPKIVEEIAKKLAGK
ncbi:MAG: response regulator [Terriglobales bacterium]